MRRRYILDSNAVNALANLQEPLRSRFRQASARGGQIGTCEPVVAELYYGLQLSATREANTERIERTLRLISCWPFDRVAAREYGRLAADLRRRGRQIQIIDVMLAAVAMNLPNCTVVTTDSDLSAVPGLDVENWMLPTEAE